MRANLAADVPEHQRMTDQEVSEQVTTFMLACVFPSPSSHISLSSL